jgi:hypothetical protein
MRTHIYNVLAFLLENGQEFSVATEVSYMHFDPPLPAEITRSFTDIALFVLAGYTFESAWLDKEALHFEAGFGEEGFGSHVTMPLLAIRQIFIGDYPVAINVSSPVPFQDPSETTDPVSQKVRHSMEALLRNPENQKLLNTIKKY